MYREKYCQRRAVEMFASGKTKTDVINMLREENAKESELNLLADKFYQDYEFLWKEKRKLRIKNAEKDVLIGSVLIATGILISLFSYLLFDNGRYFLFTGLLIFGLVYLAKGISEKINLNKESTPQIPT